MRHAIYNYTLLLFAIAILAILAPSATAEGCCINYEDTTSYSYFAECVNDGEFSSLIGLVDEDSCTGASLRWETINCDEVDDCAPQGCCCLDDGGYVEGLTLEFACNSLDTFTIPEAGENCYNTCNPTDDYYTVSGRVLDEEGQPVEGINVTLNVPRQKEETDGQGRFTFTAARHGDSVFSANNDTCQGSTDVWVNDDIRDITINLVCSGNIGGEICAPEWNCEFTHEPLCGRNYDVCTATNCGEELNWAEYYCDEDDCVESYKPLPYKPCAISTPTCNNDGNLDEGEICDGEEFADGTPTCEDYNYATTEPVRCVDCQIDTSNCDLCPTTNNPTYCTEAQCDACPNCEERCGNPNCLETSPLLTQQDILYPESTANAVISWSFDDDCLENVNSFIIEQCKGELNDNNECDAGTRTITLKKNTHQNVFSAPNGKHTYEEFTELSPQTTYCFKVKANIEETGSLRTTESGWQCAPTGDAYCMKEHPDEFCDATRTIRQTCLYNEDSLDERNVISPVDTCPDEFSCLGPDADGMTTCSDQTACELCNGLYGMYGYLAHKKPFLVPYLDPITLAQEDKSCQTMLQAAGSIQPCYEETTKTASNKLSECSGVTTCYDYHTETACENSPCLPGTQCDWHQLPGEDDYESLSAQTGIGVCAPSTEQTDQPANCSVCDEDNQFMPACTQDFCLLYNNTPRGCYYANNYKPGTSCFSPKDVSCTIYQTQDDCEGGQSVEINVEYDDDYPDDPDARITGTHKREPESDDYFGYGVCEWVEDEQKCIKNADGFTNPSQITTDCTQSMLTQFPTCGSDVTPPNTTLNLIEASAQPTEWNTQYPVYSSGELFDYTVDDNLFPKGPNLNTWFGYSNEGVMYPNLTYTLLKAKLQDVEGDYNISYYSKDGSMNLEEVEHTTITFDNKPPYNESFDYDNVSYLVGEDEYRTNITITMNFTDNHGSITCNNTLLYQGMVNFLGGDRVIITEPGEPFSQTYNYLRDDQYTFIMTCRDHEFLNNTETYVEKINIDADQSITNPQPTMDEVLNLEEAKEVIISVETDKNATCKYSKATDSNEPLTHGTQFDTTGEKSHVATLTNLQEGLHQYYVGCEFFDGKTTEGNAADMIKFSVDNSSPKTIIIDQETQEEFNPIYYAENRELTFQANDTNPDLQFITEGGQTYWDGNAQVNAIYYCLSNNANHEQACETDDYTIWTGQPLVFDANAINGKRYIHYYSQDIVGNNEIIQTQIVRVRNLEVLISGVELCPKDSDECIRIQAYS